MDVPPPHDPAFAHDAFLIERGMPAGAGYRVRPMDDGEVPGPPIALVAGGATAGGHAVLSVRPAAPGAAGRRYEVSAADGSRVGVIEHRTEPTILRATWAVLHPADQHLVAWARERRVRTALARRLRDRLAPRRPSRTDGSFDLLSGQRPIGRIAPAGPGSRDRLVDLRGDRRRTLDRRAAVALAVALDALGRR